MIPQVSECNHATWSKYLENLKMHEMKDILKET
jgi:hypothetical protein